MTNGALSFRQIELSKATSGPNATGAIAKNLVVQLETVDNPWNAEPPGRPLGQERCLRL